jgi:hypothetical protein
MGCVRAEDMEKESRSGWKEMTTLSFSKGVEGRTGSV